MIDGHVDGRCRCLTSLAMCRIATSTRSWLSIAMITECDELLSMAVITLSQLSAWRGRRTCQRDTSERASSISDPFLYTLLMSHRIRVALTSLSHVARPALAAVAPERARPAPNVGQLAQFSHLSTTPSPCRSAITADVSYYLVLVSLVLFPVPAVDTASMEKGW